VPALVQPSSACRASFLAAEQELAAEGKEVVDEAGFAAHLARLEDARLGRNLPPDHVAWTALWLVEGAEFLGRVSIRHGLNDLLRELGGHIGYVIRPTARRRGFGTLALRLALPHAAALGIDPALVTCDETNIASRKIIEACGGVFERDAFHGEGLPRKLRFWLATRPS
jgi:predicted acetyltransferase